MGTAQRTRPRGHGSVGNAAPTSTVDIDRIVTAILRDFGLGGLNDWDPYQRRTPADIATLHAKAAVPTRVTHPAQFHA